MRVAKGNGFYHEVSGRRLYSYRPPLTPLVAAGFLKLFNYRLWSVHVLLCFIGAVTSLNITFIAKDIFDRKIGVISGILATIYPIFVFLPSTLLTENFSLFFYSLAFLLLLKLVKESSLKLSVILGLVLGLETLNKPTMVGFAIILAAYLYFSLNGARKVRFANVAVVLLCAFMVTLPWTIRNYRIHHRFVLITTNGGITFWDGHNEYVGSGFQSSYYRGGLFPNVPSRWEFKNEVEWDRKGYAEGFKFIVKNPLLDLKHDLHKLLMFWSPYNHIIHKLTYFPVLILGLIGIYLTRREARRLLPFYIFTFYLMSLSVVYQGIPRYRIPVMIFLLIMAAVTLEEIFHNAKIVLKR